MSSEIQLLPNGTELVCFAGNVRVNALLNSGGQGEVYRVELNSKEYAMKYYFPERMSEQMKVMYKKNLQYLIQNPIASKSFLWPIYLVDDGVGFGYIMELIPDGFAPVSDWEGDRLQTSSDIMAQWCVNISDAFRQLHEMQYSYKDISSNNIYLNPTTGEVLIIDNDNITKNLLPAQVSGTPGFRAPEIVEGSTSLPSMLTDLHSLAIVLFKVLCCEHPLHGAKEYDMSGLIDESERNRQLYGYDAQFIFADTHNLDRYISQESPAHLGARDNWKMYPQSVKELFCSAFVDGIKCPHERPKANKWMQAFQYMTKVYCECDKCKYPHFPEKAGKTFVCQHCGKILTAPTIATASASTSKYPGTATKRAPRIKIKNTIVELSNGAEIVAGHFEGLRGYPSSKLILKAKWENGRLAIKNVEGFHLIANDKKVGRGEYTDWFSSNTKIIVEGLECKIAF